VTSPGPSSSENTLYPVALVLDERRRLSATAWRTVVGSMEAPRALAGHHGRAGNRRGGHLHDLRGLSLTLLPTVGVGTTWEHPPENGGERHRPARRGTGPYAGGFQLPATPRHPHRSRSGARGRRFESCRACYLKSPRNRGLFTLRRASKSRRRRPGYTVGTPSRRQPVPPGRVGAPHRVEGRAREITPRRGPAQPSMVRRTSSHAQGPGGRSSCCSAAHSCRNRRTRPRRTETLLHRFRSYTAHVHRPWVTQPHNHRARQWAPFEGRASPASRGAG
jgi:hypothetical protein